MTQAKRRPCEPVDTGSVGESGASDLLHHRPGTDRQMVLRTTGTSLCPNTGAVAVLTVNGLPKAFGDMTANDSSIQTEAKAGDHVVAIVHTVPLFNDIACVRLGELFVALEACAPGGVADTTTGGCLVPCTGVETRDWYAWNNKMPPRPDEFHIVGEVQVPNPGVDVELVRREPQGINPAIILLDLILTQRPGIWPQVLTWKRVRFDQVLTGDGYEEASILCGKDVIAKVKVEDIH